MNFLSKKIAHAQPLDDEQSQAQDGLAKIPGPVMAFALLSACGVFLLPEFTGRWFLILAAIALCLPLLILNRRGQTKFRTTWLVCVLICLFPLIAHAQASAGPKRVLVLYWYNKDYGWNVNFDRNFQAVLQSAPAGRFEYYPEYLETDRFPGEHQSRLLHDHLLQKYADRSIDVLVATSDASLNFLLKYRADLFPQAPIVFVVTRTPPVEQLAAGPGMTGLNVLTDHRRTVDLALGLHPETKHLFIVSGTLEHDKRLETLARAQLQSYESRVAIEYLTDLLPEQLIAKTKALPEQSLVLYVWQQARSDQGRVLETQEILASFAPSVRVPIYGMTNLDIGKGAVGGYINLAEAIGARAGEIVTQVANGVRPQDIPVANAPLVPIFDWRELRRRGISESRLPANSVVRFKELSLWDQYRWQIVGITSLFLVEALLIFALLAQRARRSRAEEQNRKLIHSLGERVKELTALHHTARVLHSESKSVPKLLQEVVELLPPAWQYPEVTAARITFGYLEFKTANFASTPWSQKAQFEAGGSRGVIEVLYLEERPEEHIGPFLLEERNLIDSLAEMISSALNRRFTQDELRASEERFTKAFQASPVAIAILNDRDRTFLEVNDSWEAVFGYNREETIGRTALELNFFNVEDRDRLRALGESQGFLRDEELDVRTKQGETRHVTMSAERFMISGELCNLCIFRDITERKLAEEALEESQRKLEEAQRLANIGYWESDLLADPITITLSEETRRLLGKARHVLSQAELRELVHPDDRQLERMTFDRVLQTGRPYDAEYRIKRPDGDIRFVHVWDEITYDEGGRPTRMFGTVQDVTERKRADEELKASREQLRALSESLTRAKEEEGVRIARELHDELGSSLTSLKWSLLRLNKDYAGNGSPVVQSIAREKVEEMVRLVDTTINTVRRISSELRPGVLDNLGLVPAIEWHAQQFQERTGIICTVDSLIEHVDLNGEQATAVFRIFQEAMTNVLRHAQATKVNIIIEEDDGEFIVEIKDNGRGITESELSGIHSLGLVGMRERANSVGGNVKINGVARKGTAVIVRLRIKSEHDVLGLSSALEKGTGATTSDPGEEKT